MIYPMVAIVENPTTYFLWKFGCQIYMKLMVRIFKELSVRNSYDVYSWKYFEIISWNFSGVLSRTIVYICTVLSVNGCIKFPTNSISFTNFFFKNLQHKIITQNHKIQLQFYIRNFLTSGVFSKPTLSKSSAHPLRPA